ncbi:MAG: hypothetical protein NC826_01280 [Candidatus Omnitrophica bacterium]|nr:hypothetical protein [Candidatus Omnitrophota bacterium]
MLKNRIFNISNILIFIIILFFFLTFIWGEQLSRDPFISLVTEDGRLINFKDNKENQLELEGILYDHYGRAAAIVNSEIVRIGDWIGEHQVYKIERDRVILLKEGKEYILKLEKGEGNDF